MEDHVLHQLRRHLAALRNILALRDAEAKEGLTFTKDASIIRKEFEDAIAEGEAFAAELADKPHHD